MTKKPGDLTEHNQQLFGDITPYVSELPYIDDDWFRFYLDESTDTTYFEVHELCWPEKCTYRDEPCPWQRRAEELNR